MKDQLTGLTSPTDKAGVHNLSKFRLCLIERLLGEGAQVALETMVASAMDAEAVRQDLFRAHFESRPVSTSERELVYRLLRIGHSYGFRYHLGLQGGTERGFACQRGERLHFLNVDFQEWPERIGLVLTVRCSTEPSERVYQQNSEVGQPEAVAARFVELCEISLNSTF